MHAQGARWGPTVWTAAAAGVALHSVLGKGADVARADSVRAWSHRPQGCFERAARSMASAVSPQIFPSQHVWGGLPPLSRTTQIERSPGGRVGVPQCWGGRYRPRCTPRTGEATPARPGVWQPRNGTQAHVRAASATKGAGLAPKRSGTGIEQVDEAAAERVATAIETLVEAHAKAAPQEAALLETCHQWGDQAYLTLHIEGWTVVVNTRLLVGTEADLGEEALKFVRSQLHYATRVLHPFAVNVMRRVPIWLEVDNDSHYPSACYHPSRQWLEQHGFDPAKAHSVEVTCARKLLANSIEEPLILLHELAHGYHDIHLGWYNKAVRAAYEEALNSGRYDEVVRSTGHVHKSYAMADDHEYFAKLTESYIGTNDSFPFVNIELKKHDPAGWRLMRQVWGSEPRHWRHQTPKEWSAEWDKQDPKAILRAEVLEALNAIELGKPLPGPQGRQ